MSICIHVTYRDDEVWYPLHVSGSTLSMIRSRNEWEGKKVFAIKYPDGMIWDCVLGKWKEKK